MSKKVKHIHYHIKTCLGVVDLSLKRQEQLLEKIMTQNTEIAEKLDAVSAQLSKASVEIQANVQSLRTELESAGTLSPAADASLINLQAAAQALDDLNPDLPVAELV